MTATAAASAPTPMPSTTTSERVLLPTLTAGNALAPIIPGSFDDVYRLAKAISLSGLAPKEMDTPEKLTVAILHGLEIGLPPMQAIQRIAVINGRPCVWGDAIPALLLSRGFAVREWLEGSGDARAARCEVTRPDGTVFPGSFSVMDAQRAQLWQKAGPWQHYPERMLKMRARGFAARDGAADVLGGLYIREEVEDIAVIGPASRAKPPANLRLVETASAPAVFADDVPVALDPVAVPPVAEAAVTVAVAGSAPAAAPAVAPAVPAAVAEPDAIPSPEVMPDPVPSQMPETVTLPVTVHAWPKGMQPEASDDGTAAKLDASLKRLGDNVRARQPGPLPVPSLQTHASGMTQPPVERPAATDAAAAFIAAQPYVASLTSVAHRAARLKAERATLQPKLVKLSDAAREIVEQVYAKLLKEAPK